MPVSGSRHQGNIRSYTGGTQCTLIALTALIYAGNIMHPSHWTTHSVDSVLLVGDSFYTDVVNERYGGNTTRMFGHHELPNTVLVYDSEFHTNNIITYYGIVGQTGDADLGSLGVMEALTQSYRQSPHLLATFNEETIALLHYGRHYFLFDSHARDLGGNPDPDGTAVLLDFNSIPELFNHLSQRYRSFQFEITPVDISMVSSNQVQNPSKTGSNTHPVSNNIHETTAGTSYSQEPAPSAHILNTTLPPNKLSNSCEANTGLSTCESFMHACTESDQPPVNYQNINHTYSLDLPRQKVYIQSNHSYLSTTSHPVKRKRTSSKLYTYLSCHDMLGLANADRTFIPLLHTDPFHFDEIPIAMDILVSTEFYDPINLPNHNTEYERAIRAHPSEACGNCERFLFPNQVNHLRKINEEIACKLNLLPHTPLCSTCHKSILKLKIPSISSFHNDMHIDDPPEELSILNKIEKRLLSQIQPYLTMIILPGGQYAEKGLVLDLPVEMENIARQLPEMLQHPICLINYEASKPHSSDMKHLINPKRVWNAMLWLKENNHLYSHVNLDINNGLIPGISGENCEPQAIIPVDEDTLIPIDYIPTRTTPTYPSIRVPRSTSSPVSIYEHMNGEELAFPWLFPHGRFGFNYNRAIKITPSMYFRCRLYNRHGYWRKDILYLLHAAVSFDMLQLKHQISICLKMTHGSCYDATIAPVTAGYIRNRENSAFLLQNSYMFMKKIRGTIAYFRNALNNLLSMLRSVGPPTLFITLSADDMHWPELGMCLDGITYEFASHRATNYDSMRSDPLLSAIHFDRRFAALFKYIIKDKDSPLGSVSDYFIRVEFQNRGSPHYHIFLWIKNIPSEITSENIPAVIQYINKVIHCNIPDPSSDPELFRLVTKLQTHHHSKYCSPHINAKCRFRFPRPVCQNTRVFTNNNIIHHNGRCYEPTRNAQSTYINPYNPTLLRHFRSNMDIQLVNNAQSVAYYICSYICKSEPDELRTDLYNLIHNVFNQQPDLSSYQRLWRIGTTVLRHRRMSAQEAAFRLSQMAMIQVSRKIIYLNVRPPHKRFRMMKSEVELSDLEDDSTDIFRYNILDYYRARPASMNDTSLYNFASWFDKSQAPKVCSNDTGNSPYIYIETFNVWFRRRKSPVIIRYPQTTIHTEDYYYSMLLLLLPHRSEDEIVHPFHNLKDAFLGKQHILDRTNDHTYFSFTTEIDTAVRRIQLILTEQQAQLSDSEDEISNDFISNYSQPHMIDLPSCSIPQANSSVNTEADDLYISHDLPTCRLSKSELLTALKQLTPSQSQAYEIIHRHYNSHTQPLRLFISGAGGSGKSYLTNILIAYLQHYHVLSPGKSPVLVCAPTGTAARNIFGQTIHSLLCIIPDPYLSYSPLSGLTLAKVRSSFNGVHTLIIDEISMVSADMLTYISRRLNEISSNDIPFGGLNVIVVGDLYQLKPVRAKMIFTNKVLWHLFQPILLQENVRQSNNRLFVRLLNRARIGELLPQDYDILKDRLIDIQSNDIPEALHIFPTRRQVSSYNTQRQVSLNSHDVSIHALNYFSSSDITPGQIVPRDLLPDDDHIAGNLPLSLSLSIGTRVMLIRNILTSTGLVNGAIGTVHSFEYSENDISSIHVLFDDRTVGLTNINIPTVHLPIPISQVRHTFLYKGRAIVRFTFPLVQCWACTIHKVQGMTLENIVIDIGNTVFEPGMAYVALSRVTNLHGLHIMSLNNHNFQPRDDVLTEYARLRQILESDPD